MAKGRLRQSVASLSAEESMAGEDGARDCAFGSMAAEWREQTRSRSGSDQYDDLSENTANDNASKGSRLVRSCPCSEFQMNYLEETKNFTPFRSVRQPSAYTVRFVPSACNLLRAALVMKWGRSHVLIITSIRFKIWDRIIR